VRGKEEERIGGISLKGERVKIVSEKKLASLFFSSSHFFSSSPYSIPHDEPSLTNFSK